MACGCRHQSCASRLTLLLLYAYGVGIVSSPQIERATDEDMASWLGHAGLWPGNRVLTGNQQPDHSRITAFRRRNLEAQPPPKRGPLPKNADAKPARPAGSGARKTS